jgi:hypothetical protein
MIACGAMTAGTTRPWLTFRIFLSNKQPSVNKMIGGHTPDIIASK